MSEILTLLSFYYACSALAAEGLLTQGERFECNRAYQTAKVLFLDPEDRPAPGEDISNPLNKEAYRRFKAWERANPALVEEMKARGPETFL